MAHSQIPVLGRTGPARDPTRPRDFAGKILG